VQPPREDTARPLGEALAWLEQQARVVTPDAFVDRRARWRSGNPSPKQLGLCRRRGIAVPRQATAGDIADLIDTEHVTSVLDSLLATAA
jgi:hypothetical protein